MQKLALSAKKLSPEADNDPKRSPSPARSRVASVPARFYCQTRYNVLPGRHSQRSTRLLRNERLLKSGLLRVNLAFPSVTA